LPFSRLMRPAPYSVINNRLVLDAIFHRDFHGTDSTVFAAGSNKNGDSPFDWSCPVAQNIPDKNDILDAFTHVRRAGPNVTDSMWMFGGISIQNTTGNRYFDFELYQTDIYYDRTNRVFGGYGPDFGHTTWKFDAAGNILSAGDIIFSAEYGSSSLSLLEARIWINKASLLLTPTGFNWGGQFDGASSGSQYGYASILPKTAGAFYTGLQCGNGVWTGPFSCVQQDNTVITTYVAKQFMEFSVNLSKLGIDPGNYTNNPCGTPFRRVLVKTRASTSFTAELKDFIAPYRLFDYAKVNVDKLLTYFCGSPILPPTTISVTNPISTSTYTWATTNGHIIGSSTGSSIVVDSAGTYTVTQKLNTSCPAYAYDTVAIIFEKVCKLLKVEFLNFTATKLNNTALLKWQAGNNQDAASYDIEYSLDNRSFFNLASIPSNGRDGIAEYSFSYLFGPTPPPVIYYRVKIMGKEASAKYSNVAVLRISTGTKENVTIFPNPTKGELWLSFNSAKKETADVYVLDATGKIIHNSILVIRSGENLIRIPGLDGKPKGTYLVKIKSASGFIIQKVIIID
ncbi:MAG: T9SS type A sorting domain-containing protein, partial [Ferruginibacter sp.]